MLVGPHFTPQRKLPGAACIELNKLRKVPDSWLPSLTGFRSHHLQ
jgi:hypothetical protein